MGLRNKEIITNFLFVLFSGWQRGNGPDICPMTRKVGTDVFSCSAVHRDDHEPLLMCQFVTNPLDREADKYISVKATALVCHLIFSYMYKIEK
jgi:hypothetical protein